MKLDVTILRYMSRDCWRILVAMEMGMRNHQLVPVELVFKLSGIKRGGCLAALTIVHKHKLVHHENQVYNGYRLTYLGYDFLAIHAMMNRKSIISIGGQVGIGKESDIFLGQREGGVDQCVLKLCRLGRVSFRNVKQTRDYIGGKSTTNWLYLSRLGAQREFQFMQLLHSHGYPIPEPIDANRHCIVMSYVEGRPLNQVRREELKDPASLYATLMGIIMRFAADGLIHCDFNEFNIMSQDADEQAPIIIDFPQMVSTNHENAQMYFERDVDCIELFFKKRFDYVCDDPKPQWSEVESNGTNLDILVKASGADMTGVSKQNTGDAAAEIAGKKPKKKVSLEEKIRNDVRRQRNRERDAKRNARTKREGKRIHARNTNREMQREVKETL